MRHLWKRILTPSERTRVSIAMESAESVSSFQDDSESDTPSPRVSHQKCSKRLTPDQRVILNSYYRAGMTGESKSHLPLIERCSAEIDAPIIKIIILLCQDILYCFVILQIEASLFLVEFLNTLTFQRWIKKKNYRQKHSRPLSAPVTKKKISVHGSTFLQTLGRQKVWVLH